MKWARFFLLLFLIPSLVHARLHEKECKNICNQAINEDKQCATFIEQYKKLRVNDGEARIRVLNDAIGCCSRAISHYDTILNDIAQQSEKHRHESWCKKMKKDCENKKNQLTPVLNDLKTELNNTLSFVAFEKAKALHEESEKKGALANTKYQNCPPRHLNNVDAVVSVLIEVVNLYEEAASKEREALAILTSAPSPKEENIVVLKQSIETYQAAANKYKKEATDWPASVAAQKNTLKTQVATLQEDSKLFIAKGLKRSSYEAQKQMVPLLEQLIESSSIDEVEAFKEELAQLKNTILSFEAEIDSRRLTEAAPSLSQEDFKNREEMRRELFFKSDFLSNPELFLQNLLQPRPCALPLDGHVAKKESNFTLYTDQFYRFLVQSDNPASCLLVKVYRQGQVIHEESIAIPTQGALSWERFLTKDGMIFIPETKLKTEFGLDLRLNFACDPKCAFSMIIAQKASHSNYQFSISLDGGQPLYTFDLSIPPPWQLDILRKPALLTADRPIEKTTFSGNVSLTSENERQLALSEPVSYPILDQFIEELKKDPLALASYVYHEIALVDPFVHQENGIFYPPSIHRNALRTYLEKKGSVWEQCQLLTYLLRKAGYPTFYVVNGISSLPKTFVEKLLLTKLPDDQKEAQVCYPWVVFFDGKEWISLFPWMKEIQIKEGYDLYSLMPEEYSSADRWILRYLKGDETILRHIDSDGDDTAGPLFVRFVEDELRKQGLSSADIGLHRLQLKKQFSSWKDLSRPSSHTDANLVTSIDTDPKLFAKALIEFSSHQNPQKKISHTLRLADIGCRLLPIRFSTQGPNQHLLHIQFGEQEKPPLPLSEADRLIDVKVNYEIHLGSQPFTFDQTLSIAKGTSAALCFHFGGATPGLTSQFYEQFSAEKDEKKRLHALLGFVGASYFEKCGRSEETLSKLHKIHYTTAMAFGLAKLSPDMSKGPFKGEEDLILPQVDMFWFHFLPSTYAHSTAWHQELRTACHQFQALTLVNQSSNEHQILREVFKDEMAVSTVKLLQLAHQQQQKKGLEGEGFLSFTRSNLEATEKTPEAAQSLYFSHLKDLDLRQIKEDPTGQWKAVNSILGAENPLSMWAYAYMTPGLTSNPNGSYHEMGTFIFHPYTQYALISNNNLLFHGGLGSPLPSYYFTPFSINQWQLVPTLSSSDASRYALQVPSPPSGLSFTPPPALSSSPASSPGTKQYSSDVRSEHKSLISYVSDPVDVVTGAFYIDKVTLPNTAVISYDYDHSHRIIRETKPHGKILENKYVEGRVEEQRSPMGQGQSIIPTATFDYQDGFTIVKDAKKGKTTYKIFQKQIYKIIDPLGLQTLQAWFIDEESWFDPKQEKVIPWNQPGGAIRCLKSSVDKRGLTTYYLYDGRGNSVEMGLKGQDLTGSGESLIIKKFSYNDRDLCIQEEVLGQKTITTYDTTFPYLPKRIETYNDSSLISYVDLEYNSLGQIEKEDQSGSITLWKYDSRGFPRQKIQVTGTDDPDFVTTYTYNNQGQCIEVRSIDSIQENDYDIMGCQIESKTFSLSGTLLSAIYTGYDLNNQPIWKQTANPNNTLYLDYHASGLIKASRQTLSPSRSIAYTLYEYDPRGYLIEEVDPLGYTTYREYNAIGQVRSETKEGYTTLFTYEPGGMVETITSPSRAKTIRLYTTNGLLKEVTFPDGTKNSTIYDFFGRPILETKNDISWEIKYDDANHRVIRTQLKTKIIEISEFDARGNLIRFTDAAGYTSEKAYDGLNRIKTETSPSGEQKGNITTIYEYDFCGNCTTLTDGDGRVTRQTFDGLRRITQRKLPDGSVIGHAYDLDSNLSEYHLPNGAVWKASYDTMGRKILEELQAGRQSSLRWEYTYENGYLKEAKDPMQRVHAYLYESSGRLFQEIVDGGCRTYTYDPRGFIATAQQTRDSTASWLSSWVYGSNSEHSLVKRIYDPNGRLSSELIYLNSNLIQQTKQTWNASSRSLQIDGHTRDFIYQNNRLVQVSTGGIDLSYAYDLSGSLKSKSTPWSTTAIGYNASGLPESIQTGLPDGSIQESLDWYASGKLLSYSSPGGQKRFTYTTRGYLQAAGAETYHFDFGISGIGVRTAAPGWVVPQNGLDAFGKILTEIIDKNSTATTYNPMGEAITHGQRQLDWDPWGRLIKVSDGAFTWEASYDALGRRLQTRYTPGWSSTLTTTSFYDPEEEFQEIGIKYGDKTFWKIYGPNSCDAVTDETGASVVLMHNTLDQLAGVVSRQGTVYSEQFPSSYGLQSSAPSIPSDLLSYAQSLSWHSHSQDPTGLIWMGARYYDPKGGRFLSPDPIGYPICLDLYAYAGGDPVNYLDPDGRFFSPAYQLAKPTVLGIKSTFSNAWHNPHVQGSVQAFLGLTQAGAGDLAILGSEGFATPVAWPALVLGVDQFITGMGTAITGRPRISATEHVLQKAGMPAEWASLTTGVASAALTMGSTAIIRSAQSAALFHPSLPTPSISTFSTVNRPATSSMSGHLLKNKLIAEEISGGHAFAKHVIKQGEFPGLSQYQFQRHIQNILNNPTEMKLLTRGRTAYWDQKTGTVIIRNPVQGDGGTAFRPTAGYDYFLKELK